MNLKIISWIKGILLAVFVLSAGVCYSCSRGADDGLLVSEAAGWQEAEAKDSVGAGPAGSAPESDGTSQEQGGADAERNSTGSEQGGAGTKKSSVGSATDGTGTSGGAADVSEPEICYVHVCGQVVHPGVYRLEEGQRIYEAIELAGGFTAEASRTWLNLAEKVADGMKLEVPDESQAQQWQQESPAAGNPPAGSGKVNINTATREELMTLKGIGEARAEDIIRFREKQGYFQAIEDIMKVPGIKDAAFEKIKDEITV